MTLTAAEIDTVTIFTYPSQARIAVGAQQQDSTSSDEHALVLSMKNQTKPASPKLVAVGTLLLTWGGMGLHVQVQGRSGLNWV